jgi:hypothetical protein
VCPADGIPRGTVAPIWILQHHSTQHHEHHDFDLQHRRSERFFYLLFCMQSQETQLASMKWHEEQGGRQVIWIDQGGNNQTDTKKKNMTGDRFRTNTEREHGMRASRL